jgi:putative transposase
MATFCSSKTCSGCGTAKGKLALSQRTYVCLTCGLVLDRDHNAARNLAALAADTGESRREPLPMETMSDRGIYPWQSHGHPEEPARTQHHHRNAIAR